MLRDVCQVENSCKELKRNYLPALLHCYLSFHAMQYVLCVILLSSLEGHMSKILEELQNRAAEAKKRLDEANTALQAAQQVQQQAQHNFNVWNLAAQIEAREEQQRQTAASEKQLPLPTVKPQGTPSIPHADEVVDVAEGPNKTDIVRNLLKQHPAGMSAVDIWDKVGAQFNHRPYLYSVLKSLRDRQEIIKRRNRYSLAAIAREEGDKEQPVVH